MELDGRIDRYVMGADFSELLSVHVRQSGRPRQRAELLQELVRGKSVLHIGCVDHIPHLGEKIRNGTWLHARLAAVAAASIGIDVNREGVELLRDRYDIRNVIHGDIAAPEIIPRLAEQYWAYALLGEVIEHVDNPVAFLRAIADTYRSLIGRFIITVPNAFRAGNILSAFRSCELINSDHRYWFTPYTILKIVHRASLRVEALELCQYSPTQGLTRIVKDAVLHIFPLLAEDLVVICRKCPDASGSERSASSLP
jgi:SAM-dependent methyltransferase